MADPVTLSTATIFSAITTTFKLAEFCLALKEVSSESRIFLSLIERVRKDLREALRERHEKAAILQAMPGKRAWIDDTITDIKQILNEIGLLIENARVDVDKGKSLSAERNQRHAYLGHESSHVVAKLSTADSFSHALVSICELDFVSGSCSSPRL
ncbi:MAG: hypothetical protein Q9195_008219 [Heterodermia aff. obscurata]